MYNEQDEEFHVASRNSAATKHVKSGHLIHYAEEVARLVAEAPHKVDSPFRYHLDASVAPPLDMSLERVLQERTSSRQFGEGEIAFGQLWKLCFSATGIRQIWGMGDHVSYQRNAPNSGGLGSIEVFVIVLNVSGLPPGIYHFDSVTHEFVALEFGHYAEWLNKEVLFQDEFSRASVAVVLAASFHGLRTKYGIRGYRSALLDAGHCSENVYLAATALGLQVCATTGFIDDELDEALGLDGLDRASLEVLLVGPRSTPDIPFSGIDPPMNAPE